MIELFIIVAAALLLILLLTAVVVLPMLYVEYLEHRRTQWIAVAPTMVEVELDQLPVGLATFVTVIRPVLEEAGFRTAVIADAPRCGSEMRWSHILLLNRSTGERAGVTSWVEGDSLPLLGLTFAAEFPDGERVVTDAAELLGETPWQVTTEGSAAAELASRVYAVHRERMAKVAGGDVMERVMPQEGKELEWVQEKARAVAAAHAAAGFELDPSGHYFRPTRRHAVRMVARDFRMVPVPKPKPVPPGFPVSLGGASAQTPGKAYPG